MKNTIFLLFALVLFFFFSCKKDEKTQLPVITSFSPESGKAGDVITIQGTNFSSAVSGNVVKFNNTTAEVTEASATIIKVKVPVGATTGKITVKANGREAVSNTDFQVKKVITYVAGSEFTGIHRAVYWKDGIKQYLPQTGFAWSGTTGIFITATGDVYISGAVVDSDNKRYACYWKNGAEPVLLETVRESVASAVCVENGSVYCSGYYKDPSDNMKGCYWKNSQPPVALTTTSSNSFGSGLYVSAGETYISDDHRGYWKGNTYVQVSSAGNVYIQNISKSGTSVFVSGYESRQASYWKNGVKTQLVSGAYESDVRGMAIDGNDVYCTGYRRNSSSEAGVSLLWKNSAANPVQISYPSGQYTESYGITVFQNKVYLCGNVQISGNDRAFVYANGEYSLLPGNGCSASEIAITEE